MKSLKKKLKVHNRLSQSTPLINGSSTPDLQPEVAVTRGRVYQSVSSMPEDDIENDLIPEKGYYQRQLSPPSSPVSPTFSETSFGEMSKKEAPWVTEARVQSKKEPVLCAKDATFHFVEITTSDSWLEGLWQTAVVLLLFFALPSVIFAVGGGIVIRCVYIPNVGRSKREQRKLRAYIIAFLASLLMSILKDSIIATAVVHAHFRLEAPLYEIVFAALVLLLLVVLLVAPIMVYALSGANFSYACEATDSRETKSGNKRGMKLAVEFMKTHLSSLHEVTNLREQGIFLLNYFPKSLFSILAVFFLLLCALRNTMPLFISASRQQNSFTTNMTINATNQNTTLKSHPAYLEDLVAVLSGINSFIVTFTLAAFFVVTTAWSMVMLKLWRSFAATLKGSDDLLCIGMDGMVAWWRVYQTALFVSLPGKTPFGLLYTTLNCLFSVAVTAISVLLLKCQAAGCLSGPFVWLITFDNLMLILGLIASHIPCYLVSRVLKSILQELSLKRLNMVAQAGASNTDAEKNEGEYHVHLKRFKGRNLRTSQQLLQELFNVLRESDSHSMLSPSTALHVAVVVLGLASLGISVKGLV